MKKSKIKAVLKSSVKGAEFINRSQVKRVMGWGNDRTAKTLDGLDYICMERTKQYLVDDVADRIYAQMVTGEVR